MRVCYVEVKRDDYVFKGELLFTWDGRVEYEDVALLKLEEQFPNIDAHTELEIICENVEKAINTPPETTFEISRFEDGILSGITTQDYGDIKVEDRTTAIGCHEVASIVYNYEHIYNTVMPYKNYVADNFNTLVEIMGEEKVLNAINTLSDVQQQYAFSKIPSLQEKYIENGVTLPEAPVQREMEILM